MTCFPLKKSLFRFFLTIAFIAAIPAVALSDEEKEEDLGAPTNAPLVVELYTATDCSSCVIADRLL